MSKNSSPPSVWQSESMRERDTTVVTSSDKTRHDHPSPSESSLDGSSVQTSQPLKSKSASSGSEPDSDSEPSSVKRKRKLSSSKPDIRKWTTEEIYAKLAQVDPETAKRYHPHNRRRIQRALEVYLTSGRTMSEVLGEQHSEKGASVLGGPLRFPYTCIIWVQCQQNVLDERTDKRVDEMIQEGLLQELSDFHTEYNQYRHENQLYGTKESARDYQYGIFQNIGFKEFHKYLMLSDEKKESEEGKQLLCESVEEMKKATRRYARKQVRWINGRLLQRRGANVPAVYGVDSTFASDWHAKVHLPASSIIQAYLQDKVPEQTPLPYKETCNKPEYNVCDVCNLTFVTTGEWQAHLKGRKHKRCVAKKHRQEKYLVYMLGQHQRQLEKTVSQEHCDTAQRTDAVQEHCDTAQSTDAVKEHCDTAQRTDGVQGHCDTLQNTDGAP